MFLLALSYTKHTTVRLEEVGSALAAVAGGLLFLAGLVPFAGRRLGMGLGGLCLAAGSVLWILALRWGTGKP
jgi:hypothetical protein